MDNIKLDEIDINVMIDCIQYVLANKKWRCDNDAEFDELVQVRALRYRLVRHLNGGS